MAHLLRLGMTFDYLEVILGNGCRDFLLPNRLSGFVVELKIWHKGVFQQYNCDYTLKNRGCINLNLYQNVFFVESDREIM